MAPILLCMPIGWPCCAVPTASLNTTFVVIFSVNLIDLNPQIELVFVKMKSLVNQAVYLARK